jgi:hypothetical protein
VNNRWEGECHIASFHILPLIANLSLSAPRNHEVYLCFVLVGVGLEFTAWLYPQMVGTNCFCFHAGD